MQPCTTNLNKHGCIRTSNADYNPFRREGTREAPVSRLRRLRSPGYYYYYCCCLPSTRITRTTTTLQPLLPLFKRLRPPVCGWIVLNATLQVFESWAGESGGSAREFIRHSNFGRGQQRRVASPTQASKPPSSPCEQNPPPPFSLPNQCRRCHSFVAALKSNAPSWKVTKGPKSPAYGL
jgi:hypothetical protein